VCVINFLHFPLVHIIFVTKLSSLAISSTTHLKFFDAYVKVMPIDKAESVCDCLSVSLFIMLSNVLMALLDFLRDYLVSR